MLQEMKKLDKEYLDKKYSLLKQYIKSKLDYWQKIPKAYYIYEGKNGYNSNHILIEKKIYRVYDTPIYIHCMTGELYDYDYLHGKLNPVKEKRYIRNFVFAFFDTVDGIDAKKIYEYYMERVKDMKHTECGNGIDPSEWIKKAITNDIDITLEDYVLHYDDDHGMTEESFNKKKEEYTAELAKENLLNLPKKT